MHTMSCHATEYEISLIRLQVMHVCVCVCVTMCVMAEIFHRENTHWIPEGSVVGVCNPAGQQSASRWPPEQPAELKTGHIIYSQGKNQIASIYSLWRF